MSDSQPKRVLLVDDDAEVVKTFRIGLEISGFKIFEAIDGPSALKTLDSEKVDIAIIDQGLPGMKGVEVGRKMREHENGKDLILCLFTGNADPDICNEATTVGFQKVIQKPISIKKLAELVSQNFSLDNREQ